MTDFHDAARVHVEKLLAPDEVLEGICGAKEVTLFRSNLVALVVTDRRLIVLPLDKDFEPNGMPLLLLREDVEPVAHGTIGPDGCTLRTRRAHRLKLALSDDEGEAQAEGAVALRRFLGHP